MPSVSRSLIVPLLLVAALGACDRQSAPAGQGSERGNATTSGEAGAAPEVGSKSSYQIDRSHKGEAAPDFVFTDARGRRVTLADFAGRPILVNLWATWCAPCIAEMPQLDTLAEAYGKDRLQVLTLSQDTQGAAKVLPFFAQRKFRVLQPWLDPENSFGFHYGTGLLPTSVLYDREGKEVARISGAPDWTGEDAVGLIEDAIN